MRVKDLLQEKGMTVHTVPGDFSVLEAINFMAGENTSALIVARGGHPLGIFTERDVMRCHLKHGEKAISEVNIQQAMTDKLIVAAPDDPVDKTLSLMIQTDIRHLPVAEEGKIIGMLSIRALFQHYMTSLSAELESLTD
ncbi:MAG: CBS domain-containing protein, partial [Desulforhabdus sp.]|nr:CBS domain-containing protein [Desulforhabdus sp.]